MSIKKPQSAPPRVSRRTVFLGALTVFLPLWVLLAYWGGFSGRGIPLSRLQAVVFAAFSAGAGAMLAALILANHARLRQILRLRKRRVLLALILALGTPALLFVAVPVIPLALFFMMLGSIFQGIGVFVQGLVFWVFGVTVLTALWYGPVCLVISGLQSKAMRIAVFALIWWGIYGLWALAIGFLPFTL